MTTRHRAAILGATGMVGQRFVQLLADHPWFGIEALVASPSSAGKPYGEAADWVLDEPLPDAVGEVVVEETSADLDVDVAFSALPGGKAAKVERELAREGVRVFSNARDHRMADDVPLVIPEVNADHLDLVETQGTDGFVVCNANCSAIVLTLSLAPLHDAFGVEGVHVTTLQAVSGAGYPGVASLDIVDNVLPRIGGEEAKLETEPRKMLGTLDGGAISLADLTLAATCTRVPVTEGHAETVHVTLAGDPDLDAVRGAYEAWSPDLPDLPSLPDASVHLVDDPDRPQTRRDRYAGDGMTVTVGRLRESPLGTARYVTLGSNTIRGAAGQSVLNAELCVEQGRLPGT